MIKTKDLIQYGCSQQFAKAAMQYSPMFSGDMDFFIQEVEEMLRLPRTAQQTIQTQVATSPPWI